jgi:hypothetical protein
VSLIGLGLNDSSSDDLWNIKPVDIWGDEKLPTDQKSVNFEIRELGVPKPPHPIIILGD